MLDYLFAHANVAFVVLLLVFLVVPIVLYLTTTWPVRRSEIVGALSERGVRLYFKLFYPAIALPPRDLIPFFVGHYNGRYGRRHYVAPIVLLGAVVTFLLVLVARGLFGGPSGEVVAGDLPWIAVAAIAGAFNWVMIDVIGRSRSRDLAPVDLYWATLRFVIAVPLAFALTGLIKDEAAAAVAFLLGTFPTRTLLQLGRRIVGRRLGVSDAEEPKSELLQLQGITPSIAERFHDEGVVTILQLAYSDPIDLSIRGNFSFNFVIDCVSQALAWLYFEDQLATARRCALRGAHEVYNLLSELDGDDVPARKAAEQTIQCFAAEVHQDVIVLKRRLQEIAGDPYTAFIWDIWAIGIPGEAEVGGDDGRRGDTTGIDGPKIDNGS